MKNEELNEYIKNFYCQKNVSGALMISGEWGIGKSHYIEKSLIPFFEKNLDKKKVIKISLYGLKSLEELNKCLYFECLLGKLNRFKKLHIGKIVGKTIIRNVSNVFDIDLKIDDNDLRKLYENVNLEKKLIIFEDIERSRISILDFMSFIYNLVDQDKVKVLLVANENEILRMGIRDEYLKIKEKTIADTIYFYNDGIDTIKSIIQMYDIPKIKKLDENQKKELSRQIFDMMEEIKTKNLRILIYGLNKAVCFLGELKEDYNYHFLKHIFLGVIAFCLKNEDKKNCLWNDKTNYSTDLGTFFHPLFKQSYNYIITCSFDENEVKRAEKTFVEEYNNEINFKELDSILYFYVSDEKNIRKGINDFIEKLNKGFFSISQLIRVISYLIKIKYELGGFGKEVEKSKKAVYRRVKSDRSITLDDFVLYKLCKLQNKAQIEFDEFVKEITEIVKSNFLFSLKFDYNPERLNLFLEEIIKNKDTIISRKEFLQYFDIDKLIKMVGQCTAQQLQEVRNCFGEIYNRISNIKFFLFGDKEKLEELEDKLININEISANKDKVYLYQLKLFIEEINTYIKKVSN